MGDWQDTATAEHKRTLRLHLAEHLGWPDLKADTSHKEWKFNVWYFHDPTTGKNREVKTRPVKLKCPMPPLRLR